MCLDISAQLFSFEKRKKKVWLYLGITGGKDYTFGWMAMFDYSSLSVEWYQATLECTVRRGEEAWVMGLGVCVLGLMHLEASMLYMLVLFVLLLFRGTVICCYLKSSFGVDSYDQRTRI